MARALSKPIEERTGRALDADALLTGCLDDRESSVSVFADPYLVDRSLGPQRF
jgi:hypothetical protein